MLMRIRILAVGLVLAVLAAGAAHASALVPKGTLAFSASELDIASDGSRVRIAEVPGLMQSRFHYDQSGKFIYSVVVDLKTKQIVGFNDRSPSKDEEAGRSDTGPPSGFTGIWLLGEFPGGGRLYGEYQSGVRVATIIVQPNGTIVYLRIA